MEIKFQELISQITDFMKSEANTNTVIGKSFQLGEFSCIPIIRVGMGFGSGGGEGEAPKEGHGEGGGVAGGIGIDPIGFLVAQGENISFISTKTNQGLSAAFEKLPGLIEKFMKNREAKETVEV